MSIWKKIIDTLQAGDQNSAFVLFRFPESENLQFWQGKITEKPTSDSYFIFAPFLDEKNTISLFLEEKNCKIQSFNLSTDVFKTDFFSAYSTAFWSNLNLNPQQDLEKDNFKSYQDRFLESKKLLQAEKIQKIVLSHQNYFPYQLEIFRSFVQLLENFNHALVYLFYSPNSGLWMGASPELLLEKDKNLLKTTALAGTKTSAETWTEKEKKEQLFVTDFIEEILKKNQLKKYQKTEPYTFSYGALAHLKTDFTISVASDFQEFELLKSLHPTPAVCGTPQDQAYDFLKKNEKHREYYTGFLGQINAEKSKIFVNLRCAKIEKNHFYLYAGAGITLESQLEKEWQEIQNKLKNLEKYLIYA